MEYHRDPKNQIYADIAYRLGKIIYQYERINTSEEKFESTLYLAVLQNLMTNCNEYVRQMTKSTRKNSIFKKEIEVAGWGLRKESWIKNTFDEELNLQNFITRIRNSISHPTPVESAQEFPSSGFTSLVDGSDLLKKFRFINSPDTSNNRIKQFSSEDKIREHIDRNKEDLPDDITFTSKKIGKEIKYFLCSDSKDFARISIIDLEVSELGTFVKHLVNYLAQPIQKNWDGVTIKELLAA